MSDEWLRSSLADIVHLLRSRRIGAVELTESVLQRIASRDDEVGAFITVTEDLARPQARAAQQTLDREGAGAPALTGVPLAVKDLIDVRGVPTTAASKVLATNIPTRDATVWTRLRRAGATLVGKANTHEFAYGGTTEPTRNPWDIRRMVGGSSGGSAAALAAGMCFGALGSDTAGSIRIPAAFCGVVGLKPTNGVVERDGVTALSETLDCVGPMARTPIDAALLFSAMIGPRQRAVIRRHAADGVLVPGEGRRLDGLRVGLVPSGGTVSPAVAEGFAAAAAAVTDAGAELTKATIGDLEAAARSNFVVMGAEAARIHRGWLASDADKYSPYVRDRLREGGLTTAGAYLDALDHARELRRRCDDALAQCDVLLLTGMPCVAPIAYVEEIDLDGVAYDRDCLICRDTAFANLSGHPVIAVPSGLADGLPTSVQIVGRPHHEARLFQVAQVIFERLGAPIP